jgi:hypothetical protein
MHALTETGPWGSAIILGFKPIENRTWAPPKTLIGQRFVIHQGKEFDAAAWDFCRELVPEFPEVTPSGALLGTVKLRGYVRVDAAKGFAVAQWHGPENVAGKELDAILASPWRNPDASHLWCLSDPRPLATPIPCKGMQRLWRVPAEHTPALEGWTKSMLAYPGHIEVTTGFSADGGTK